VTAQLKGFDAREGSLMVMEHSASGVAMNSDDAAKGVAAFLAKRASVWSGT
jgi:enoyl-CoA hydratase